MPSHAVNALCEAMLRDLHNVLNDGAGFGEFVILTTEDGNGTDSTPPSEPVFLRGVFDLPTTEVQPGSRIPIIMRRPTLLMGEAQVLVILGRPIRKTDVLTVRGIGYRVETALPDGTGGLIVKLLEL